jgi:uncharacterized protein (TIRG00374 family)
VEHSASTHRDRWHVAGRILVLALGALSLYLLAPQLISLFGSWPELSTLEPAWFGLALLLEGMSRVSLWSMQRVAFQTRSWFAVGTSQLASTAAGSVVPGGAATQGAIAYQMLTKAGIRGEDVASGFAASTLLTTATVLALPLLALPAMIGGVAAPRSLINAAWVGIACFVALGALSVAAFRWDGPLLVTGRALRWLIRRVKPDAAADLPERLLAQRDRMREAFGRRWQVAVAGAIGKVGFDYLALLCCLAAVGARPSPSLVLLAYVAAQLLATIPVTPGGLGFVEAGLAGLLAAAGVGAHRAVVTTLAYRLISFWVPLPAGLIAYLLFRRRYDGEGLEGSASNTPA